MREILFHLGPIPVYSYGFMLAISFIAGMLLAQRLAEESGIDRDFMANLSFGIALSSIAGAKLLYIIVSYRDYLDEPSQLLEIRGGGFVYYGGFLAAYGFAMYYTYRTRQPMWQSLDCIAMAVPLGLGITRIGCFLAGCCFGKPTDLPWGVTFPFDSPASERFGPIHHVHPVQLYASALGFITFGFLLWLWHRRKFPGQITFTFILIYSLYRPILEMLRADRARGFFGPLSTSQWISIATFTFSIIMLRILKNAKLRHVTSTDRPDGGHHRED